MVLYAAIYAVASFWIARRITPGRWLQWLGFAVLVLNPLAWRAASASLAIGLLALAVAWSLHVLLDGRDAEHPVRDAVGIAALCAGAMAAERSLAAPIASLLISFLCVAVLRSDARRQVVLQASAMLPVALFVLGYALVQPLSQGGDSWFDLGAGLLSAVFLPIGRLQVWMPLICWMPFFIGARCATQPYEWAARFAVLMLVLGFVFASVLAIPRDPRAAMPLLLNATVVALFGAGACDHPLLRLAATAGLGVVALYFAAGAVL